MPDPISRETLLKIVSDPQSSEEARRVAAELLQQMGESVVPADPDESDAALEAYLAADRWQARSIELTEEGKKLSLDFATRILGFRVNATPDYFQAMFDRQVALFQRTNERPALRQKALEVLQKLAEFCPVQEIREQAAQFLQIQNKP